MLKLSDFETAVTGNLVCGCYEIVKERNGSFTIEVEGYSYTTTATTPEEAVEWFNKFEGHYAALIDIFNKNFTDDEERKWFAMLHAVFLLRENYILGFSPDGF